MIRFIKNISTILFGVVLFCSCSPTARLNRLIDKHPYLATTTVDTVFIPDIKYDTTIVLEKDTLGLSAFIDSLLLGLPDDSPCIPIIRTIKEPIIKYVDAMPVLADTAEYEYIATTDSTSTKLLIKVWQEGHDLRLSVEVLDSSIIVDKQTIVVKKDRKSYLTLITWITISALLLILIAKKYQK
jgi:hypothetical protein